MRILNAGVLVMAAAVALVPAAAEAQKKDRNLITREEIIGSAQKDGDLYQAIRSLRSHFLNKPRGQRTMNVERGGPTGMQVGSNAALEPIVYLNGNKLGELNLLKNILAADVFEVRYLDPARAQDEFGADASGGAVVVTLVKGIKDKP
jgi:hypothetical protein